MCAHSFIYRISFGLICLVCYFMWDVYMYEIFNALNVKNFICCLYALNLKLLGDQKIIMAYIFIQSQ